jgi:hypothetical protein
LDPSKRLVEVSDWRASVPDLNQCAFIAKTLEHWVEHCSTLIGDLNTTAARYFVLRLQILFSSNERAIQLKEKDEQHEKEVEQAAQDYKANMATEMHGYNTPGHYRESSVFYFN